MKQQPVADARLNQSLTLLAGTAAVAAFFPAAASEVHGLLVATLPPPNEDAVTDHALHLALLATGAALSASLLRLLLTRAQHRWLKDHVSMPPSAIATALVTLIATALVAALLLHGITPLVALATPATLALIAALTGQRPSPPEPRPKPSPPRQVARRHGDH